MKILAISGSFRKGSYNTMLCRSIKSLCEENNLAEVEVYTIENIPMFNQDLENPDPQPVQDLRNKISNADALIISTPEYDNMLPGAVKNMFDWLSRSRDNKRVLVNKPAAIVGCSNGSWGTVRSQNQMLFLGLMLRMNVSADWRFPVPTAQEKFDSEGNLTDDHTRERLVAFLQQFTNDLK